VLSNSAGFGVSSDILLTFLTFLVTFVTFLTDLLLLLTTFFTLLIIFLTTDLMLLFLKIFFLAARLTPNLQELQLLAREANDRHGRRLRFQGMREPKDNKDNGRVMRGAL